MKIRKKLLAIPTALIFSLTLSACYPTQEEMEESALLSRQDAACRLEGGLYFAQDIDTGIAFCTIPSTNLATNAMVRITGEDILKIHLSRIEGGK